MNCIFSLWLDLLVNQSRLEKPWSSWVSAWLRTLSAFSSVPKAASVFGSLLGLLIAINWWCWAEKSVWKPISTFWVTLLCKRHGAFRSIAYYRRGLSSGGFNRLLGLIAYLVWVTRLILPVVICLSLRLSHASLSISNLYGETADGSLKQLLFIWWFFTTWITVVILGLIHAWRPDARRAVFIR